MAQPPSNPRLPAEALGVTPKSHAWAEIAKSQTLARFSKLTPWPQSLLDPDELEKAVRAACHFTLPTLPHSELFRSDGNTQSVLRSSEINATLNKQLAESSCLPLPRPAQLIFDEPLLLRSHFTANFADIPCAVEPADSQTESFLFEFNAVSNVRLLNLSVDLSDLPPNHGVGIVRLQHCSDVELENVVAHSAYYGTVLRSHNSRIRIHSCTFHSTDRSAIYIQGTNHTIHINNCQCLNQKGRSSNWSAGIVVTAIPMHDAQNLSADFWCDGHWPHLSHLVEHTHVPEYVLVENSTVAAGRSSGIYGDGSRGLLIANCTLNGNDKEGICLDFGAAQCIVQDTHLENNGRRALQHAEELEKECVLQFGYDKDGAAQCKLPAISLDNAVCNTVRRNLIEGNWGGGIKCVRASFANAFVDNRIQGNSLPRDNYPWRFAGILIDGCPHEFPNPYIDDAGSHGNVISGNQISGHDLAPGVLITWRCQENRCFNNTINEGKLAIEARYAPRNQFRNNRMKNGRIYRYIPILSPIRKRLAALKRWILRR